jgi:DNA primase
VAQQPSRHQGPPVPDLRDPRFALERETLKLVLHAPAAVGRFARDLDANDFTHPTYRAVWEIVAALGGPTAGAGDPGWPSRLRDQAGSDAVNRAITSLGVEPLLKPADSDYAAAHVFRLQEVTTMRRINEVKSKLQRTNPVQQAADYNRMFGELVALEQHRRSLRERAIGGA